MKRSELKVGETYVSAGVGYDRDHFSGKVAILLDTNVDASRNGFDYRIRRPALNPRTGKATGNRVLALMETGYGENRVSRAEAENFKPSVEWIDRWLAAFKPWPTESEKLKRDQLREEIPDGWTIEAIPPARLWMTWAEFLTKRKEFEDAEAIRQAERAERAANLANKARKLASEASEAGLKRFTVSSDGEKITLDAEDFRNLAWRSLRATA